MTPASARLRASKTTPPAPSRVIDPRALVARIRALQDRDGAIRWIDGGLWDPWNQVESAMGLAAAGETEAAARALDHLAERQSPDGGWRADMGCAAPLTDDGRRIAPRAPAVNDTNFAAYVAVGVWHLARATGSLAPAARHADMIAAALDFALAHQRPDGAIVWRAREPGESLAGIEALLAGASSIYKSLECGVRAFEALGRPADHWRAARTRLGAALRTTRPGVWTPKTEFAMDWYYPVLAGALSPEAGRARLAASWRGFLTRGWGCRCVAHEPWATAAETAELAMALAVCGKRAAARRVLGALGRLAAPDGDLWMGWQHRENAPWPEERPSWTAGAALLAEDVVRGASPGAAVFLETLAETPLSPCARGGFGVRAGPAAEPPTRSS